VRQWARAYRAVVEAHPNLVLRIVTSQDAVAVAAGEVNGALHRALQLSGLRPAHVERGVDVIVDFVNGSLLATATKHPEGEPADPGLSETLDDVFEFGLDVVIAGLVHLVP
jgi:hypothetical protein